MTSQANAQHPLIGADELLGEVGGVTLLDVRWGPGGEEGRRLYAAGHIPGAVFVDLSSDLADPPGEGRGRFPLPDAERFGAVMRRCGVSSGRPVVVYDDNSGTMAARGWWLLRYFGHPSVRLLDGGWSAWLAAGGVGEAGDRVSEPGDFVPQPGGMPMVEADGVLAFAREGALVDVRVAEQFRGEDEPVDPVAGRIPGSVNVPIADSLTVGPAGDVPIFKSREELAALYGEALTGPVAFYCGAGVLAAHGVLAAELAGARASLYPGSWSEWISDGSRPIAIGEPGATPGDRNRT